MVILSCSYKLELFAGFAAKAFRIALANDGSFSRVVHRPKLGLGFGFSGIEGLADSAGDPFSVQFVFYEVACHARILIGF